MKELRYILAVLFSSLIMISGVGISVVPVSYTHLDVYKRQVAHCFHVTVLLHLAEADNGADDGA